MNHLTKARREHFYMTGQKLGAQILQFPKQTKGCELYLAYYTHGQAIYSLYIEATDWDDAEAKMASINPDFIVEGKVVGFYD